MKFRFFSKILKLVESLIFLSKLLPLEIILPYINSMDDIIVIPGIVNPIQITYQAKYTYCQTYIGQILIFHEKRSYKLGHR